MRPADIPRLEHTLATALADVQRSYPHSSILLLTALAEGADRLAARVAKQAGMGVIAVLPFREPEYERDFETPQSLAEFRDHLARADGIVRLAPLEGVAESDSSRPGPVRDREYAKAGAYIAAHSQIFVAFWDGVADAGDKIGGTAQTVAFRLEGAQAPYVGHRSRRMFGVTAGPVFHIRTPRISNPASTSLACDLVRVYPANAPQRPFDSICELIDTFNRDARRFGPEIAAEAQTSTASLLNTSAVSVPATVSQLSAACRQIIAQYVAADGLALRFRGRVLSTWARVYVGVAVTAFFFNVHSSFFSVGTIPWFFLASLACSMFTATYVYGRAEKGKYHTKYLDYRALAEALRIQFFWRVAGVSEPVVDWYLRKQRSDLEWIRSALRSCDVFIAAAGDQMDLPIAGRMALVASWIEDQRKYYGAKARAEKAKLERERGIVARLLKISGGLSIVLALMLTLPVIASGIAPSVARLTPSTWQHGAWMVVIPVIALSAGLQHGYSQQLARAEHARQFERMADLFYAAEKELRAGISEGRDNAALIRELGIEALDENGDWLILHRERPLEVPPG